MTGARQDRLRSEVIEVARALKNRGLVKGTSGNVSVRYGDDGFLVTPTGIPYEELTPEKIVLMDWNGGHIGSVLPSSEWRFHRDMLRSFPHFNAVVHTHSPYATAMSIHRRPVPAVHYRIGLIGGDTIPCVPYATFGTQELADAIIAGMQGRRGCLLAHHGTLAAHDSLAGALAVAEVIEELSQLYLLALGAGEPPVLSANKVFEVIEKHKSYGQQPTPSARASNQK